jgi:hypothetical protein
MLQKRKPRALHLKICSSTSLFRERFVFLIACKTQPAFSAKSRKCRRAKRLIHVMAQVHEAQSNSKDPALVFQVA